jgi:hypothetical protein
MLAMLWKLLAISVVSQAILTGFLLLKKLLQPQTTEQQLVESEMRNGSLSEGAKDVSKMRCDSGFRNESRSSCLVR